VRVNATFRPALRDDARGIAELFLIASGGVAEYVWSTMAREYPGLEPIEIGTQRYAREEGAFSYRNTTIAEIDGATAGMMHVYKIPKTPPSEGSGEAEDPVLAPYARPDVPGSLYVSGIAFFPEYRGGGLGTRLLGRAGEMAREEGCGELSLRVFEENERALRLYERHGFEVVDRAAVVPHESISYTGDVLLMKATV
jgi:ribosomal protein S18 acetylase RimI-like enzyme